MAKEQFISNLKYIRSALRLKQPEFGELLGLSLSVVKSYESGANSPTAETLIGIAKKTGTTAEELWETEISEKYSKEDIVFKQLQMVKKAK